VTGIEEMRYKLAFPLGILKVLFVLRRVVGGII
jgi:hypothetical protein